MYRVVSPNRTFLIIFVAKRFMCFWSCWQKTSCNIFSTEIGNDDNHFMRIHRVTNITHNTSWSLHQKRSRKKILLNIGLFYIVFLFRSVFHAGFFDQFCDVLAKILKTFAASAGRLPTWAARSSPTLWYVWKHAPILELTRTGATLRVICFIPIKVEIA